MRADIGMLRAHSIEDASAICAGDALLLAGANDPVVSVDAVRAWAPYLPPACTYEVVPGGHTFAFDQGIDTVLRLVNGAIARAAGLGSDA